MYNKSFNDAKFGWKAVAVPGNLSHNFNVKFFKAKFTECTQLIKNLEATFHGNF